MVSICASVERIIQPVSSEIVKSSLTNLFDGEAKRREISIKFIVKNQSKIDESIKTADLEEITNILKSLETGW